MKEYLIKLNGIVKTSNKNLSIIAKELGVTPITLRRKLKGENDIGCKEIEKIKKICNYNGSVEI